MGQDATSEYLCHVGLKNPGGPGDAVECYCPVRMRPWVPFQLYINHTWYYRPLVPGGGRRMEIRGHLQLSIRLEANLDDMKYRDRDTHRQRQTCD